MIQKDFSINTANHNDWEKYLNDLVYHLKSQGYIEHCVNHDAYRPFRKSFREKGNRNLKYQIFLKMYDFRRWGNNIQVSCECILESSQRLDLVAKANTVKEFEKMAEHFYQSMSNFKTELC